MRSCSVYHSPPLTARRYHLRRNKVYLLTDLVLPSTSLQSQAKNRNLLTALRRHLGDEITDAASVASPNKIIAGNEHVMAPMSSERCRPWHGGLAVEAEENAVGGKWSWIGEQSCRSSRQAVSVEMRRGHAHQVYIKLIAHLVPRSLCRLLL